MTQLGVEERTKGAMPKTEGDKTPEVEGKIPEEATLSPEDETPIYSQRQTDALIHAAKSDWGRQSKLVEEERDKLKTQLKTKETELEDIQSEREALNTQIDDLTSDDPKRFDLIKRDRELRERERNTKNRLTTLDERETKL